MVKFYDAKQIKKSTPLFLKLFFLTQCFFGNLPSGSECVPKWCNVPLQTIPLHLFCHLNLLGQEHLLSSHWKRKCTEQALPGWGSGRKPQFLFRQHVGFKLKHRWDRFLNTEKIGTWKTQAVFSLFFVLLLTRTTFQFTAHQSLRITLAQMRMRRITSHTQQIFSG